MAQQTINSEDLTITKLFEDYYVVPNFQREYVWEEEQVEQLLSDIYSEFGAGSDSNESEYFIGSIVVCRNDDAHPFDLIDGQQRVTTLYLILCAIRDHLTDVAPEEAIDVLPRQIAQSAVDRKGNNIFRYRVELQYEDSGGVLEDIAKTDGDHSGIEPGTRSIKNILTAYKVIRLFLTQEFGTDPAALRRFYAYLAWQVKLIRVSTESIAHALKVFETINDRGVGLDSMDLLKNLMFMKADQRQFDKLKDKWKGLVDLLYQKKEKPLRFLRYYIFSRYDVERLREDQIYDWFRNNAEECGYEQDPLEFVDELFKAAKAYTGFRAGLDTDGARNRYMENIGLLSGAARQHLILFLAGQHLPKLCRSQLAQEIENLFFAFIITRENTREFERQFARWAPELRNVTDQEGLQKFIAKNIDPARKKLANRFALAFDSLSDFTLQKYRLKYILAKLTQHIDEKADGSEGAAQWLSTYTSKDVWIEHILPQTKTQVLLDAFDKPDEYGTYAHRLGNLTLLEKSINTSVGQKLFADKKPALRQSKFRLTRSLGEKIKVGQNTAIDRAVRSLEEFETWTSEDIERRQAMLARIAHEVWDVPVPEKDKGDASTE